MNRRVPGLCVPAVVLLMALIALTVSAQGPAAQPSAVQDLEFMLVELTADNAHVIDHEVVTGDDRGGIATSHAMVFYSGDSATGRFSLDDLSGRASVGGRYDMMVSDLKSGQVYLLGHNGAEIPRHAGDQTVSQLLEVDGDTGALTGSAVMLDAPLTVNTNIEKGGLFAGYGRVLIYDEYNGNVWSIATPSGAVASLPFPGELPSYPCENWAIWGMAEHFGGEDYLVYRASWSYGDDIVRTRLSDGTTSVLGDFDNLGDVCSISANIARGRWYFHHEGSSQFGGTSETLGFADAVFRVTAGVLDGHVYDGTTGEPIQGATVTAGAFDTDSDATGYYTMTLPVGTYDVVAGHPQYTAATASGVAIVTDTVTAQDFSLVPRGRLYGYVTDHDNGFPLEATVTAGDGTATGTDPATGHYEMYLDEGAHTVTASADDYAAGLATVSIVSGEDTRQDFALLADVSFVPSPLHVTLDWQTTGMLPAALLNHIDVPYDFEFREQAWGFVPLLLDEGGACAPAGGLTALWPGPDGFGYVGEASDYEWVDISGTGTAVPLNCDDCYKGPFDLGFTFPFYGADWTQFYVGSNGHISFGSGSSAFGHPCPLPSTNSPNSITPLWGNLAPYQNGAPVYYESFDACPLGGGPCTVVTYDNFYYLNGSLAGTWQAILFDNGSVQVQILDAGSHSGDISVTGIQGNDVGAGYGLTYACDTAGTLYDGLAMCFVYPGSPGCAAGDVLWMGEAPIAGTVPASGLLDVTVIFSATYGAGVNQPGDYHATLIVAGDPKLKVPVQMTVLPPPDMGKVEGYVLDNCTGDPVEAMLDIAAGDPVTRTRTDPHTGYYAAWLVEGTYDGVFRAGGYLDQDVTLDVTAGQTTMLDVHLVPDRPCISIAPDVLEAWVVTGTLLYTHPAGLDITNGGGQDLDFELIEMEGGYITPTVPGPSSKLPGAAARYVGPGGLTFYGDRHIFDRIHPGLPVEGFDNTLVAPGTLVRCYGPFDSSTNNDCFAPGGILDGIRLMNVDPANRMLVIGDGLLDNPTAIVGPDIRADDHDITFFGQEVHAVGFDIWSPLGAATYDLYIYGPDDVLLAETSVAAGTTGTFWGVYSAADPITRLRTDDRAASQGELFDNIAFGSAVADIPWVWQDPVSGTVPPGTASNVDVVFTAVVTDPLPLGTYTATLQVRNTDPLAGTRYVPVLMHVVEEVVPPVASFTSNSPVCLGVTAVFTNTSVPGIPPRTAGGQVLETTYLWDFGDGGTSTEFEPTHVYTAAGTYTVRLEACNPAARCDTFEDTVAILPWPQAGFTYELSLLEVTFSNTSLHALAYQWAFGDGTGSTDENPVHTYAVAGTYTVALTATNACAIDVSSAPVEVLGRYHNYLPLVVRSAP